MRGSNPDDPAGTLVAERVLDLLECLSCEPLSVKQIAGLTGIPPSTVHRLLRPLLARKYVIRHGWGAYGIGLAVNGLWSKVDLHLIVARVARPVLTDLARACKRTAHLGVFHDNLVRYLVKVDAGRKVVPSTEMSEREAYCTGIGKAVLTQLSPDQLDDYLFNGDFIALTPSTITSRRRLELELETVRALGWAMDRAEFWPNLYCLSVPVRTKRIHAAISISEYREDSDVGAFEQEALTLLPLLGDAARRIGALLED